MNVPGPQRRYRSVIVAALAGAFVSLPAVVSAQAAPPVQVTHCTVLQYQPTRAGFRRFYWYDYGFGGPFVPQGSPYTDGVSISYVNTSNQVADRIVFGVNYRGDFERIIDAGTFSPNVTISHTFADVFSGYAYLGPKPNSCSARVVRFKDGSVWHAPGIPHRQAM